VRVPPRQFRFDISGKILRCFCPPLSRRLDDPFLQPEIAWLRFRLQQDLPTLGICLGAQLMAAALGGDVFSGRAGKEIGWGPLRPGVDTDAASCLQPLFENAVSVLHWHGDTFDLPEGARHLAATTRYSHQAFAWQRNALALQFHLEVEARTLERWFIGHACEISGVSGLTPNSLRDAARQHAPALELMAPVIWNAWLDSVDFSHNGRSR
jgi:GMP synthase (glutamine-hydrolysing)